MTDLSAKRVAVLATDAFEDSELTSPADALREAGATVQVISTNPGTIEGKKGTSIAVDDTTKNAQAADFDALVLPGGTNNADHLRTDKDAVEFVKEIHAENKPISVICHGGWILTDADILNGKTMTSYPSLRTDLSNAGATWVDEEVHVDGKLVSSRTPEDLPAFNAATVKVIADN